MTDAGAGRYIYVSGPYSASPGRSISANVERADAVARELVSRGFVPFVPHTMMRGWEDQAEISRNAAMGVCLGWVERCDAMLVIGMSAGVRQEIEKAKSCRVPVYESLDSLCGAHRHAA